MNKHFFATLVSIGLCFLSIASIGAKPDIRIVEPPCVDDVYSLPIFRSYIINVSGGAEASDDLIHYDGLTTFLIDDNLWVTAAHGFENDNPVDIIIENEGVQDIHPMLSYINDGEDLAILMSKDVELTPLRLAKEPLQPGDDVYAVGYPSFSGGTLASYHGKVESVDADNDVAVASTFVHTGMSGGPILGCENGQLVVHGMIHAYMLSHVVRRIVYRGNSYDFEEMSNIGKGEISTFLLTHFSNDK